MIAEAKLVAEEEAWPEVGDLVIATVSRIIPQGAYVKLDDYGDREGFLHISEVSTTWVRNLRDFVREGRKLVLKVLRISMDRGHIDLSLKRVGERERQETLLEWKRRQRGQSMLKLLSQRMNLPLSKVNEDIGRRLEEQFGGAYEAFEEVREKGETSLAKTGLPDDIVKAISSVALEKVKIPRVEVAGILELTCLKPNGVDVIKKILSGVRVVRKGLNANVNVYVIGAPKYRVEVSAKNYKEAEKVLQDVVDTAMASMKDAGGYSTFKREG